jgi:hypothetical protein
VALLWIGIAVGLGLAALEAYRDLKLKRRQSRWLAAFWLLMTATLFLRQPVLLIPAMICACMGVALRKKVADQRGQTRRAARPSSE